MEFTGIEIEGFGTTLWAAFLITVLTRMLANPRKGKTPAGTPRVLIIEPDRDDGD